MRSLIPAVILASVFCACSGNGLESYGAHLPDVQLVMPGNGEMGESLASCPTEKCLTVVVAPWLPPRISDGSRRNEELVGREDMDNLTPVRAGNDFSKYRLLLPKGGQVALNQGTRPRRRAMV